jgi:hypothetical protein
MDDVTDTRRATHALPVCSDVRRIFSTDFRRQMERVRADKVPNKVPRWRLKNPT